MLLPDLQMSRTDVVVAQCQLPLLLRTVGVPLHLTHLIQVCWNAQLSWHPACWPAHGDPATRQDPLHHLRVTICCSCHPADIVIGTAALQQGWQADHQELGCARSWSVGLSKSRVRQSFGKAACKSCTQQSLPSTASVSLPASTVPDLPAVKAAGHVCMLLASLLRPGRGCDVALWPARCTACTHTMCAAV